MFRFVIILGFFSLPGLGTAVEHDQEHWAFQPLAAAAERETIDSLVQQRLTKASLTLSPAADQHTLLRRAFFDVTGLPPTPEQTAAFLADTAPEAWARLVDRLLASPQYGERWGRHWLDVARYTESQGFEYDRLRPQAWHYRDYVIDSFNADKSYLQFMREQVAGDALPAANRESIVAASFLVCGPWDQAGNGQANAVQRATTREDELEDIVGVVGQTFLGLTVNCARCHDHKFDRISQEDYFRLKAVFEGVKHGERPLPAVPNPEVASLGKALAEKKAEIAQLDASANPDGPQPLLQWNFAGSAPAGELLGGATVGENGLSLPKLGAFFRSDPLPMEIREKTLEAWVSLANLDQGGGAVISLENSTGAPFDAIVFGERQRGKWTAGSENFHRTLDLEIPLETASPGQFLHMVIVYASDNRVTLYRNGVPLAPAYTPKSPLQTYSAGNARILIGQRHTGGNQPFLLGDIQRAALYDRALTAAEVAASFSRGGRILTKLTPEQQKQRELAVSAQKQLQASLNALTKSTTTVSYAGTRVQPPPTHLLARGEVTSPKQIVTPGALSSVPVPGANADFGLPADAPEALRRLKFAEWLTDPRNPLPARVMVNRLWQGYFAQGLVATPNDFGVNGARPTHPELLDWLARKLMESDWRLKTVHRLILNSAVYRQASASQTKAREMDSENTLLWRHTPRRLSAEEIRDAILAVSGQLNPARGGPSFQPFEAVPFPANSYTPVDKIGPEFNRRTVYRMNVNSGKDALLDAFDCPDPAVKTPRRSATTTPLQALELMNNAFVLRQAQCLADRVKAEAKEPRAAIQRLWQLTLSRTPTDGEISTALGVQEERGLFHLCWVILNSTEFVYAN